MIRELLTKTYQLSAKCRPFLEKIGVWGFLKKMWRIKIWIEYRFDFRDMPTSPAIVAEMLKDIIKDKVVCDVGCWKGYLMKDFQKYAKEVIGIEENKRMYELCQKKGLDVIYGRPDEVQFPDADVYYCYHNRKMNEKIVERLRKQKKSGLVVIWEYWLDKTETIRLKIITL